MFLIATRLGPAPVRSAAARILSMWVDFPQDSTVVICLLGVRSR